jgi:shikimate kinase
MNYILCGFKNCGKTSVGKQLADKLTYSFIDTDDLIKAYYYQQNKISLPIPEIYTQVGELEFRALEKHVIKSLSNINNTIIATGGGSVVDPDNAAALKKLGKIIYLNVNKNILKERTFKDRVPAFLEQQDPVLGFEQLYKSRSLIYKQVADIVIEASNKTVAEIIERIL